MPRATTVSELTDLFRTGLTTPEGLAKGLAFKPRATDVVVATYPKCGTTLLQQIVHGLRTAGDMDFRDISEVIPWIEVATDLEQDLTREQRAEPRAFKTHLDWDLLPKGGRSIYVLRDPLAALVSHYHFFCGWFIEPSTITLEEFALDFVSARTGRHDYWGHLASWWPRRDDDDVLFLFYEDVVAELRGTVERVAEFIFVDEPRRAREPSRIEIATRQAEIGFMRRYPTLWEDVRLREYRNAPMGLPESAGSTKVRAGKVELPGAELTDAVRMLWSERWAERITPLTGYADYDGLRTSRIEAAPRG